MAKFIVSKVFTKVSNIVAPISLMENYSVGITTQNFMSCGERCTSVDIYIHFHNLDKEGQVTTVFSTEFTSWSMEDNAKKMKNLKKFVNDIMTQYYEIIH